MCLLTSVHFCTRVKELIATMAAVDAMTAALEERLEGVRPNLNIRATLGDGHCQYRGVAMQCQGYGDVAHGRLRKNAVAYVEANHGYFLPFFSGPSPARGLASWIKAAQRGAWGDNISLVALSHFLKRPVAVWRDGSMQKPTVLVPPRYDADNPTDPIYLKLEEGSRGKEHYSALSLKTANLQARKARNNSKNNAARAFPWREQL